MVLLASHGGQRQLPRAQRVVFVTVIQVTGCSRFYSKQAWFGSASSVVFLLFTESRISLCSTYIWISGHLYSDLV